MTIAEIHGKISSSGSNISDRLEDLLTSDVFGPLRYLPFAEGLFHVLGEARLYDDPDTSLGEKLEKSLPSEEFEPDVCFWPWTGSSEPDVLIKCDDHLLMIEAKYLSGKSGEDDSENTETGTSDQLAREFQDLLECEGDYPNRMLIYLTAHRTLPKEDMESSCKAVGKENKENKEKYSRNTYWLSWFDVRNSIEKLCISQQDLQKKLVLDDIRRLLYRKGFRKFEGFNKIELVAINSIPEKFFYQNNIEKFRGFEKLTIAKIDIASDSIFYQQSN